MCQIKDEDYLVACFIDKKKERKTKVNCNVFFSPLESGKEVSLD